MSIEEGKAPPAFQLNDQHGNKISLASLKGQNVILYFYPKDDTPGCTKEACGFRSLIRGYEEANTIVLGVSPDDAASHAAFIKKYDLPFSLLSDPNKKVMEQYGAWGEKNLYGKKVIGVIRSSVLIDADGKVKKHWRKVPKAADHAEKVLAVLQSKG